MKTSLHSPNSVVCLTHVASSSHTEPRPWFDLPAPSHKHSTVAPLLLPPSPASLPLPRTQLTVSRNVKARAAATMALQLPVTRLSSSPDRFYRECLPRQTPTSTSVSLLARSALCRPVCMSLCRVLCTHTIKSLVIHTTGALCLTQLLGALRQTTLASRPRLQRCTRAAAPTSCTQTLKQARASDRGCTTETTTQSATQMQCSARRK
jgi:hypothetical protein